MKHFFFGLFLLILLPVSSIAIPAIPDSAEVKIPIVIRYTHGTTLLDGSMLFHHLDSILDDIEIVNPAIHYFYNDLSNIGSAADPKIFARTPELLAEYGNSTFDLYRWKPSRVRFFKTNKRFSDLTYHTSGGKEQHITLTLSQQILKNWNAGIDFSRMGSLGFLTNGTTFVANFDFFTWYHLPDNRYHVFASAAWNSIKNEVNGGLADDSLFQANDFSNGDLKGLKTHLTDAEQRVRNHIFSLMHYYDFKRRHTADSAAPPVLTYRLKHLIEYERASYAYSDQSVDSSFYQDYFFSSQTDDSLAYDEVINKLSLERFLTFDNFKPVTYASLVITGGNQWFEYHQHSDTTLTNYFAEVSLRTTSLKDKYRLNILGRYIASGANEKDYLFRLIFEFPLLLGFNMEIGLQRALESPALMYNRYESNHFIWNNTFNKTSSHEFIFTIEQPKYRFRIGGTSARIGGYIYYDEQARPAQSADSLQLNKLFIQKDFTFGKFHLNNSVWIQETDDELIRVPGLLSHHSFFLQSRFYKKKLEARIGFDIHYSDSYFSNSYSPATSVFYQQHSTKTNGYAMVDFFIAFRIKSARMFLKLQNAGDGLLGNQVMNTPGYPLPGLLFQFGLNWRFFD